MGSPTTKICVTLSAIISLLAGGAGGIGGYKIMDYYDGEDGTEVSSGSASIVEEHSYIEQSKITEAIDKVAPSVVSVMVSKNVLVGGGGINPFFNDPFFDQFFNNNGTQQSEPEYRYKQIGGGSGFIVSEDGLILTNKHVVSDEEADYTVIMKEGKKYAGKVVSRDPFADLAVVQMYEIPGDADASAAPNYDFSKLKKPAGLPKVEIGTSSNLRVGQYVVAIGNALAEFENTVTLGIVSATGRSIVASDQAGGGSENLTDLIQTDAAINPGNSGGPLVNLDGQVIGINVAVAQSAQGIGFALPIDDVKPVLSSVEKYGEIVRPVLGVRYMMLDKARADELMIKVDHGALLTGDEDKGLFAVIPGGAGDKAGLKIKDVILEVDEEKVTVEKPLSTIISKYAPGDKIKLKVWRSGDEIDVDVTLGSSKDFEQEDQKSE
jgi:S1-C subfamily serine protease